MGFSGIQAVAALCCAVLCLVDCGRRVEVGMYVCMVMAIFVLFWGSELIENA